jgi:1-acyl-sn-glycerol-3-phosphate acyltransferase
MKGHTGAARLALQTGAPVVPMAQWGAHEVFPRYAKRFHVFPRKTARVLVGEPVDLSAFADRPLDRATLSEATEVIMDAITDLLEVLRGEAAPAERWDPAVHKQSKHGRFIERGSADAPAPDAPAPDAPEPEDGK